MSHLAPVKQHIGPSNNLNMKQSQRRVLWEITLSLVSKSESSVRMYVQKEMVES